MGNYERTIELLSLITGISGDVINLCCDRMPYKTARIPKKTEGKFRELNIPQEPLMGLQKVILKNLLYRFPISLAAHCAVPSRSVVSNARVHLGGNSFFNLDFKNAFPSVDRVMVSEALEAALHKTSLKELEKIEAIPEDYRNVAVLLSALLTYKNQLPQGAPTSPCLLNLVCYDLDVSLLIFCEKNGIRFSRYADDLWFSSIEDNISRKDREIIVNKVISCGFRLNRKKIHYRTGKAIAPKITGVSLVGAERKEASVSRAYIENCRVKIYKAIEDEAISENEIFGIMGWITMVKGEIPNRLKTVFASFIQKRCPDKLSNYAHLF